MGAISSINFKKSNAIQTRHNDRDLKPNYLISDTGCEVNRTHRDALKLRNQIIKEAIETYTKNTKQKFQAKSYEWSAVCNIKPDTTMQDLERLAEHFEEKYGFQCYQIAIHRDEGYIDDDGEKIINHHAHLEFVTLDKQTGKSMFRANLRTGKGFSQIQTEVAEILKMKRGISKEITKQERIEPREFAQMKEAERKKTKNLKTRLENLEEENKDLNRENNDFYYKNIDLEDEIQAKNQEIQELEAELEQEKLKSEEVKAYIEQFRKNCAGKGLPKEFFRKISNLKQQAEPTTKELLDDTLNSLLQSYLKEKERNIELENVIQAKDQEIEALKAENNEIKAQKHTLTQEQIQEIINQALAQTYAEIAEKEKIIQAQDQEIEALKAENNEIKAQKEAEIEKKNQENTQTPNNEELTENNGKQATYFLNNFFKDDVSIFSTTNTDKTEDQEEDQDQTHNEDDLGIHNIFQPRKNK